MLKHRYNSLSESISDFDRMLDGMNSVQPLERKIDEDLLDMFRTEQELERLEQQIEHVRRAIFGSGMPISEAEASDLRKMHAQAAAAYESAADDLMAYVRQRTKELEAQTAHVRPDSLKRINASGLKAMGAVHDKFIVKKKEHAAKAGPAPEKKALTASVNESVAPRASSGLGVFRRLAGIEEVVQMPRDPGILGTTRFNAGYEAMAKPFDEACEPAAHNKKMKADAKKIKDAADDVDKAHKAEGLSIEDRIAALREGRSKDQQAAGLKKTTRAALAHGDSDFFTLKKSGEARKDIKSRGGDPDIHDVNKHMARDIVKKVTPWDPLAKGNKESPQKRLADARLGRSNKR